VKVATPSSDELSLEDEQNLGQIRRLSRFILKWRTSQRVPPAGVLSFASPGSRALQGEAHQERARIFVKLLKSNQLSGGAHGQGVGGRSDLTRPAAGAPHERGPRLRNRLKIVAALIKRRAHTNTWENCPHQATHACASAYRNVDANPRVSPEQVSLAKRRRGLANENQKI